MTIIASYPRSGSTFLRFVLCHIFYPDIEHDFKSVNKLIPTIESEEVMASTKERMFYKTHQPRPFTNVHLVRHVGDVLISEYYYQVKFFGVTKPIEQWIEENNYGEGWRSFVNYYFGCHCIKYENLMESPVVVIGQFLNRLGFTDNMNRDSFLNAIAACSIEKIREKEDAENFPNQHIRFVRDGSSGQWRNLDEATRNNILQKNKKELILLGYA